MESRSLELHFCTNFIDPSKESDSHVFVVICLPSKVVVLRHLESVWKLILQHFLKHTELEVLSLKHNLFLWKRSFFKLGSLQGILSNRERHVQLDWRNLLKLVWNPQIFDFKDIFAFSFNLSVRAWVIPLRFFSADYVEVGLQLQVLQPRRQFVFLLHICCIVLVSHQVLVKWRLFFVSSSFKLSYFFLVFLQRV